MSLRDFTLQNLMFWGAGSALAMGGVGLGAAQFIAPPRTPTLVIAQVALPEVAATEATVAVVAPPRPAQASPVLPKVHASVVARSSPRLPVPPPLPHITHTRLPAQPSYAPAPYTPAPARWQRTYVVAPAQAPYYYTYKPRYRAYSYYPGY